MTLLLGLDLTAARVFQGPLWLGIALAGAAPVGVVLHGLALGLFAFALCRGPGRRWLVAGAVIAAAGLAAHLVWVLPAYTGDNPAAGRDPDLTVVQLNLRHGKADAREVVAEVDRLDAGLVVLAEVTPEALTRLRAAGLQRLLPHTAGRPAAGRAGLMVFTREPVADVSTVPGASAALQLRLGSGTPVTLIAAHAAQPLTEPLAWIRDSHALAAAAQSAPDPVLLVGDLNATDDHAFVRRLLGAGLRDAAEVANSGWQPTWPGAGGLPLLRNSGLGALDHVLVGSGIGVVSTRTRVVHGTDHRMLVARLVR